MSAPTYLVERDGLDARRRMAREYDHDHRDVLCDRLHFHFSQSTEAWVRPTRELIAERMADAVARAECG